jgi:uncharacterized LabA/DUF88 family protein
LVKFFSKPRKDTRKKASPAAAEPAKTPAKAESTPARETAASTVAKVPATRTRRAPVRPPRRDWAAEAAAAPVDSPAPRPTSLASAPSPIEDAADAAASSKRRRGTRGGRGRKKPGVTGPEGTSLVELSKNGDAPSLEAVVAHQAAVLEGFARDVTATMKSLQTALSDLQAQGGRPAAVTSQPRVGIFVDVPNLIYAAERRNINLDFGRILEYFTRDRELVRASAYAPISDDPQMKLESQRFVHHFVGHPYRIVTKPLKRFADGSMKANFDIELAIDILTMSDRLDVVVLMSGDGDFRRLVELIASRGVRVEVVAFGETASNELKSVADLYIDIGSHLDDFKVLK